MGTPSIIYGDYGDEKVTSSTKIGSLPLGQIMKLPDGRIYRHARSGGTALAVGTILRQGMMADSIMDQDVVVNAAAAIGAVEIDIISGSTTVTANYYQDGYLYTNLDAGLGSVYKILSHDATSTSAEVITFTLADHDELALALKAASSKVGFRQNEFASCLLNPLDSAAFKGIICGIAPVAVDASYFFWCQRRGAAVAMAGSAGIAEGERVACSSANAGSILMAAFDGTKEEQIPVGHSVAAGAAATYVLIHLELE